MHQEDTCHSQCHKVTMKHVISIQLTFWKVALFQVREVKEELRSMRLEAHTKQLTKELKSARAALENERKLRKVQSDTIKVNLLNMCMLNILHDVDKWGGVKRR